MTKDAEENHFDKMLAKLTLEDHSIVDWKCENKDAHGDFNNRMEYNKVTQFKSFDFSANDYLLVYLKRFYHDHEKDEQVYLDGPIKGHNEDRQLIGGEMLTNCWREFDN